MTVTNPIFEIERQYGQSIWMDNLSRDLIQSGQLKELIQTRGIEGITSNPAIFEKAIKGNKIYDADIVGGIKSGKSVEIIYEDLVFADIRNACDILRGVYEETNGLDGYVSIEVPPTIANDTQTTIQEARRYFETINRPNVMIKIPGTAEGLPAFEQVISEGINVNVTLLFAVDSYVNTAWAYIQGLEKRAAEGKDISKIASVASFFLSRIDGNIDERIDSKLKAGVESLEKEAKLSAIKGKVAIANAKIAYQKYKEIYSSDRWQALAQKGQSPAFALGKYQYENPDYSDVMYVDELIGENTVNTLPPQTIEACADHCHPANRIESDIAEAYKLIESLKDPDVDIDLDEVMKELLEDGLDKFVKPFESLMASLQDKVQQLATV